MPLKNCKTLVRISNSLKTIPCPQLLYYLGKQLFSEMSQYSQLTNTGRPTSMMVSSLMDSFHVGEFC